MSSDKKKGNPLAKITKAVIDETVIIDTLGTTCIFFYQPKLPKGINEFKKMKDDK